MSKECRSPPEIRNETVANASGQLNFNIWAMSRLQLLRRWQRAKVLESMASVLFSLNFSDGMVKIIDHNIAPPLLSVH
jgi:hypothetical protein